MISDMSIYGGENENKHSRDNGKKHKNNSAKNKHVQEWGGFCPTGPA